MFNKSKTNNVNLSQPAAQAADIDESQVDSVIESADEEVSAQSVAPVAAPINTTPRSSMIDMISTTATKPSILSEGFSFRGEIAAKGAIHVEGSLNGQIQVDELTIGARGQVEGVVTCTSLHIKGKFSGTATCNELIVTSSASVDGHVVYQTLSVQKGASIKGELLLVK